MTGSIDCMNNVDLKTVNLLKRNGAVTVRAVTGTSKLPCP